MPRRPVSSRNSDDDKRRGHTFANVTGIAPFFIVKNVPAALSFYRSVDAAVVCKGSGGNEEFFIAAGVRANITIADVAT